MSCMSSGSGKISLDNLLCEEEKSFPALPCEPNLPVCFEPLELSLLVFPGATTVTLSNELCRQLPKKAVLQDLLDEVVRSLAELELSTLTTFRGFSNALRMYFMGGRLDGFGLRHDLAMIAMAHTSSNRSSSMIRDGSKILRTSSLSYILI